MHGLVNIASEKHPWGIEDNADAVDLLTTHPYPPFTQGCFMESPTDLRANLHATVESRYLADLGHRPTLCEETGTLGNSSLSEPLTAAFLRMRLFSLFANRIEGCLWWCYSDFRCSGELPYRDVQMENDGLGLTRTDGQPKPAALEMSKFRAVADRFGGRMPEPERKAAILASDLCDDWLSLYNCYILCVQAGITPKFVRPGSRRPDALSADSCAVPARKYAHLGACVAESSRSRQTRKRALCLRRRSQPEQHEGALRDQRDRKNPVAGKTCRDSIQGRIPMQNFGRLPEPFSFLCLRACGVVSGRRSRHAETPLRQRNGILSFPAAGSLACQGAVRIRPLRSMEALFRTERGGGAGIRRRLSDPQCERCWNPDQEGHGWLTVINHRREAVEAGLTSSRRILAVSRTAGEAEITGTRIRLEPLQAAIFEVSLGA